MCETAMEVFPEPLSERSPGDGVVTHGMMTSPLALYSPLFCPRTELEVQPTRICGPSLFANRACLCNHSSIPDNTGDIFFSSCKVTGNVLSLDSLTFIMVVFAKTFPFTFDNHKQ